MARPRIEALDRAECLRLLASARVGRIGITVSALPVVLPVNFALLDADVVFRSTAGTKLTAAATGAVVAFEADAYSDDGHDAWSVLIQGDATAIHLRPSFARWNSSSWSRGPSTDATTRGSGSEP